MHMIWGHIRMATRSNQKKKRPISCSYIVLFTQSLSLQNERTITASLAAIDFTLLIHDIAIKDIIFINHAQ